MLMRLLPLNKKPKRWYNNFQFRIRNKLTNYLADKKLISELNNYDAIILAECYPNAFWKNYFAIDEMKKKYRGKFISYTEAPIDSAPLNKLKHFDKDDYDEGIYDFNLFVTDLMEVKSNLNSKQVVAGINISHIESLHPYPKKEFIAVVDFAQPGYEMYREQQINVLAKLKINTIALEGYYDIEEIRKIYSQAAVFFLSFPETFGLPIAECLASGTYVYSPDSSWPMAWRLNEDAKPMGEGILPDCFKIYRNNEELENKLTELLKDYNQEETPIKVFNTFIENYNNFFYGDKKAVKYIIDQIA